MGSHLASKKLHASEAMCVLQTQPRLMRQAPILIITLVSMDSTEELLSEECAALPMTAGNNTNLQDKCGLWFWMKVWACRKCRLLVFYQ